MKRFLILILMFIFTLSIGITYSLFKTNKNITGSIKVYSYDFCKENGYTKLSDCMLVMENYSPSINEAKNYISSKGNISYKKTAPLITYVEKKEDAHDNNGLITTTAHFTFGKGSKFDSEKGMFELTDYVNDELSDKYIGYYTCGGSTETLYKCSRMFQIYEYDIVVGQLFITGNTHLWFLIVLFEITILSYIIISLKCNSTIKVLIVVAIDLFGIFVDIPFMGISRMCINSVWILLGYYFNERREKIYGFIYSKKSVVGILLLYSVTMFLYLTMFKGNQLIYQLVNFGGIATTLIITLIIRKYDFFYTNKCFRVILKASFAIYILSDPLNYIILYTAGRDCIGIPFSSSINCLALALLRSVLTLIFPIVIYTFYGKAKQKIKNR